MLTAQMIAIIIILAGLFSKVFVHRSETFQSKLKTLFMWWRKYLLKNFAVVKNGKVFCHRKFKSFNNLLDFFRDKLSLMEEKSVIHE